MNMTIDHKKVLEKVRGTVKKKAYTFTLDPTLMDLFKELCDKDDVNQAPIIEEIIREYVESRAPKKKN